MHRKSNTQCSEINSDFSIKNYQFTCNYKQLPQNMRPFVNRMCSNYDYTKNGIPTYGADPVKTCKKSIITEEPSHEPTQEPTQEPTKESFTNGSVKTIYPVFVNYIEPYRIYEIPSYPIKSTYIPVMYYYHNN